MQGGKHLPSDSYYATPQIPFVAIDLPTMPSALVWRANDERQIIAELNALLLRVARSHGTVP